MTRRFILSYLPGTKICPWKHGAAFEARFRELFGDPTMANFQKLADRLDCSEDTIRRLFMGQEGDRHVFPKASILAELERAMEMAPGSLGAQFEVIPPPPASPVSEVEGTPVLQAPGLPRGKDTMPLGADLEDSSPEAYPKGAFYEVALHTMQTSWSLNLLKNLPRNLIQLSTAGHFPVYVEDDGQRTRLVIPYTLTGSARPMSQVFAGEARTKVLALLKPIDPGKAFLILAQTQDILITDAKAQVEGVTRTQDVLGEFRAGVGDLCKINDDLKVLQVDAEDTAADPANKDPRIGHIAKRLRTSRMAISALLRHAFPDPQVPKQ